MAVTSSALDFSRNVKDRESPIVCSLVCCPHYTGKDAEDDANCLQAVPLDGSFAVCYTAREGDWFTGSLSPPTCTS